MEVRFPCEQRSSSVFGTVYRPIALFDARLSDGSSWVTIRAIVDTGADYTLLPRSYARLLGIMLETECTPSVTVGIGGQETVYHFPRLRIRLGSWEREIPVGFLDRDTVPALLGRHEFLERFSVTFAHHETVFRW